jgi:hypothetical protein
MLWIAAADDPNHPAAADDLAVLAHRLDAASDLHDSSLHMSFWQSFIV